MLLLERFVRCLEPDAEETLDEKLHKIIGKDEDDVDTEQLFAAQLDDYWTAGAQFEREGEDTALDLTYLALVIALEDYLAEDDSNIIALDPFITKALHDQAEHTAQQPWNDVKTSLASFSDASRCLELPTPFHDKLGQHFIIDVEQDDHGWHLSLTGWLWSINIVEQEDEFDQACLDEVLATHKLEERTRDLVLFAVSYLRNEQQQQLNLRTQDDGNWQVRTTEMRTS